MQSAPADQQKKAGAIVYLRSVKPLQLNDLGSNFRSRWPGTAIKSLGVQGNRVYLRVGQTDLAIEISKSRVPDDVTKEALALNRVWHDAQRQLAAHQSHLAVAATIDGGMSTGWAEDITKLLCALLSTTEAIGVCWLNGPVLTPTDEFIAVATEMLRNGVPPLMLWLAAVWLPETGCLYTKGMPQFDSPEIFLSHQKELSAEMGMYLFEVANLILTPGTRLLDGETIDGPGMTFKISILTGEKTGKQGCMLTPMRPS